MKLGKQQRNFLQLDKRMWNTLNNMSREQSIDFFKDALEFCCEEHKITHQEIRDEVWMMYEDYPTLNDLD